MFHPSHNALRCNNGRRSIDNYRRRLRTAPYCFSSSSAETFNFFFLTGRVCKSYSLPTRYCSNSHLFSNIPIDNDTYLRADSHHKLDGGWYCVYSCYTCVYTFLQNTCSHLIYTVLFPGTDPGGCNGYNCTPFTISKKIFQNTNSPIIIYFLYTLVSLIHHHSKHK